MNCLFAQMETNRTLLHVRPRIPRQPSEFATNGRIPGTKASFGRVTRPLKRQNTRAPNDGFEQPPLINPMFPRLVLLLSRTNRNERPGILRDTTKTSSCRIQLSKSCPQPKPACTRLRAFETCRFLMIPSKYRNKRASNPACRVFLTNTRLHSQLPMPFLELEASSLLSGEP